MIYHNMYHPKANANHLYIARINGSEGLIQLEETYKITIVEKKYLEITSDWMLQLVNSLKKNKTKLNVVIKPI